MALAPLVLVIDSSSVLECILTHLAAAGFRTRGARTALEGVRIARRERPDLILSEVMLPDQDGATALSHLKDHPDFKDVPLILVSALPEKKLRSRMCDSGAVDCLHKPFSSSELIPRVRRWIAARDPMRPEGAGSASRPPRLREETVATRKDCRGMEHLRILTRGLTPEISEVRIEGQVDASSTPVLKAAIDGIFTKGVYRLVVDLKDATWISSSAFSCFITSIDHATEHGGDLVFVPTPRHMRQIAEILGLSGLLSCADDVEAALAMLP
jgi:anti-anti-sigma factor